MRLQSTFLLDFLVIPFLKDNLERSDFVMFCTFTSAFALGIWELNNNENPAHALASVYREFFAGFLRYSFFKELSGTFRFCPVLYHSHVHFALGIWGNGIIMEIQRTH